MREERGIEPYPSAVWQGPVRGVPDDSTAARTHGNRKGAEISFLPSLRIQSGPRALRSGGTLGGAEPHAELRGRVAAGGCCHRVGTGGRTRAQGWHPFLGHGSPSGSAPGPGGPARPRRRWRWLRVQVADSCRLLVPFGCASSLTAPPAAPELPHRAWSCSPAVSSSLLICNRHTSWPATFSRASHDKLRKAPDPAATWWFKVISWWRQLESRFPMFSSGLFGSCCSRDWDSASFCTAASLKGTHVLHTQTCHCSPKPQPAQGGMLEGVGTQLGLGQTRRAGTALASKGIALKGAPSALKGIPYSWLKRGVFSSQLRAGTPVLPRLLLQPPGQERVVDWEGENRGNVWGCGGLGSVSSVPAMSPAMCHLSVRRLSGSRSHSPSPPCSLWEGPPCGVWERRCTLPCSQMVSRSPPFLKDSAAAGSVPGRALGAICLSCLPCSFPTGAVVRAGSCHWAICSRGARQCQAPARRPPPRLHGC